MAKRDELRKKLLLTALDHVPHTGWTNEALRLAAVDLDEPESLVWRLFPDGPNQAIQHWSEMLDAEMLKKLGRKKKLEEMRIRDKITLAVRTRIELVESHKETAKSTLKYLALPQHTPLGVKLLYKTVDDIWHFSGDRSTDYNFYTKRGLLSGVYSSTFIYWLKDQTENHAKTWDFLDARIENVLQIPYLPKKAMECAKDLSGRAVQIFKALKP